MVKKITLPQGWRCDQVRWVHEKNGEFPVWSAYGLQFIWGLILMGPKHQHSFMTGGFGNNYEGIRFREKDEASCVASLPQYSSHQGKPLPTKYSLFKCLPSVSSGWGNSDSRSLGVPVCQGRLVFGLSLPTKIGGFGWWFHAYSPIFIWATLNEGTRSMDGHYLGSMVGSQKGSVWRLSHATFKGGWYWQQYLGWVCSYLVRWDCSGSFLLDFWRAPVPSGVFWLLCISVFYNVP